MLLIEPGRRTKFVVMRNRPVDLELLSQLDEVLGWSAQSAILLAPSETVLEHGANRWHAKPFRSALRKDVIEKTEYSAYKLADEIQAHISTPQDMDVFQASYHEIASSFNGMMLAYEAGKSTRNCILVVDGDTYECFRRAAKSLGERRVAHLSVGWIYRNGSLLTRNRWRYISEQLIAKHPQLIRKISLLRSLVLNDLRAKRFRKRWRRRGKVYLRSLTPTRFRGNLRQPRSAEPFHCWQFLDRFRRRFTAALATNLSKLLGLGVNFVSGSIDEQEPDHPIRRRILRFLKISQAELETYIDRSAAGEGTKCDADLSMVGSTETILITVSDSGSGVNLGPALKVVKELEKRGKGVVVVTDSSTVETHVASEGIPFVRAEIRSGQVGRERLDWVRDSDVRKRPVLDRGLYFLLNLNWPYYVRRQRNFDSLFDMISETADIEAVFSINEALPLAVAFGRRASQRGLPWVGHFPILVGKRPDGYFFPAPYHLAYGDQIRDHMIEAGKKPSSIEVVGAYTYDKHHGRNKAEDRCRVEADFPRTKGKKIVTVGTEAFPDPETELGPVLTAVANIEGLHVVLKLHPSDRLPDFEALATQLGVRDKIDIVKQYPLGQLLGASDLLIVVVSNIAIEAAVIGTPTLICDFSNKADVVDFVAEGLCMGCKDPTRVQEVVSDLLFDPRRSADAERLMREGVRRFNGLNDGHSSERIADFLQRITSKPSSVSSTSQMGFG